MKRKLWILLFAWCFLGLLPGGVLAETEYREAPPVEVATAAELKAALPDGEKEPDENDVVWIDVAKLAADITVDAENSVATLGKIIVPAGKTLTIAKDAFVEAEVLIENGGKVLVQDGGFLATTMAGEDAITNDGDLVIDGGATLVTWMGGQVHNTAAGKLTLNGNFFCAAIRHPDDDNVTRDHLWFRNEGDVDGDGNLVVYKIDPRNDVDLDAMVAAAEARLPATCDVTVADALTVATAAELAAAFPFGHVDDHPAAGAPFVTARLGADIVFDGTVTTLGKIIVPAGKTLTVADGGFVEAAVVIEEGATVNVESGGRLATTMGGDITNGGTLTIAEGAELISQMGGSVVNNAALTLDGAFYCGGYQDKTMAKPAIWFENNGSVGGKGKVRLNVTSPEDGGGDNRAGVDLVKAACGNDAISVYYQTGEHPGLSVNGDKASLDEMKEDEIKDFLAADAVVDVAEYGGVDTVVIPAATFRDIAAALVKAGKKEGLTINFSGGNLVLDSDALASVASRAQKGVVAISLKRVGVKALSDRQKAALDGKELMEAYELTLTVDGVAIASPAKGSVTVKLPLPMAGNAPGGKFRIFMSPKDKPAKMMNANVRIAEATFTTTTFATYVVAYTSRHFADIKPNDWYYEAVYYCYDNNYFKGTKDDIFSPRLTMNRAMFATVLYRIAGEPAVSGKNPFSDVPQNTWYTNAVIWAASKDIINGVGGNKFAPLSPVTREQMVTIFYRYQQSPPVGSADLTVFRDVSRISPWAKAAFTWAYGVGVINGMGNGTINPKGDATRAEVAQIVLNYGTKVQ